MKGRGRKAKDGAHPIDRHVGQRVRLARISRSLSQTALADAVGVTFQQVQKYEKGTNRVSASRLFEFAEVFGVEVSYFFAGAADESGGPRGRTPQDDYAFERIDIEILQSLRRIEDARLKRRLLNLIDHLGGSRRCEDRATPR
jgi:transcriptional regulator with XRE-family HTH domain